MNVYRDLEEPGGVSCCSSGALNSAMTVDPPRAVTEACCGDRPAEHHSAARACWHPAGGCHRLASCYARKGQLAHGYRVPVQLSSHLIVAIPATAQCNREVLDSPGFGRCQVRMSPSHAALCPVTSTTGSASFATWSSFDADTALHSSNPAHLQVLHLSSSFTQCACQPAARTRDAERRPGGDAGSTSSRERLQPTGVSARSFVNATEATLSCSSHSVMAKVPEEEQCKCPPEKHRAANPATSYIQGLYK